MYCTVQVRNEKKNLCYMYRNVRCSKKPRTIVSVVDPDPPLFCTGPDPSIIKQKSKKNLDFYYLHFVTSFLLFIYEN
jgi:hypothetical protein